MWLTLFVQEPTLRATKYLPDIIQLQQYLYHKYLYRIEKRKAKNFTVGKFLDGFKSGMNVTVPNM